MLYKQAHDIFTMHRLIFKDEKEVSLRLEKFFKRKQKDDTTEKEEMEKSAEEAPELSKLLEAFDDIELKVRNLIREKGFRKLTTTKLYWRWVRNAT